MYLSQIAGTGSNRLDYDLLVNGSSSSPSLTVGVTAASTAGDASAIVPISVGDTIAIQVTPTGGTTPTNICIVLVLSPS